MRYLSIRYSIGEALAQKLLTIYGMTRTESLLEAFAHNPATTLRVNTLKIGRDALAEKISEAQPTALSPVGLRVHGALRALYGFEEGLFFFMVNSLVS